MQWIPLNDKLERSGSKLLSESARHDAMVLAQWDVPLFCLRHINGSCGKEEHNDKEKRAFYVKLHIEEQAVRPWHSLLQQIPDFVHAN